MRVKVGDTWYEVTLDTPIMVELTEADKRNINSMHPSATKYAEFHDDTPLNREERQEWMEAMDEGEEVVASPYRNPWTEINPVPMRNILHVHARGILHVLGKDIYTHSARVDTEKKEYHRYYQVGDESQRHLLRGMRWDEVKVYGITDGLLSFQQRYPEDYEAITRHLANPDVKIQYHE